MLVSRFSLLFLTLSVFSFSAIAMEEEEGGRKNDKKRPRDEISGPSSKRQKQEDPEEVYDRAEQTADIGEKIRLYQTALGNLKTPMTFPNTRGLLRSNDSLFAALCCWKLAKTTADAEEKRKHYGNAASLYEFVCQRFGKSFALVLKEKNSENKEPKNGLFSSADLLYKTGYNQLNIPKLRRSNGPNSLSNFDPSFVKETEANTKREREIFFKAVSFFRTLGNDFYTAGFYAEMANTSIGKEQKLAFYLEALKLFESAYERLIKGKKDNQENLYVEDLGLLCLKISINSQDESYLSKCISHYKTIKNNKLIADAYKLFAECDRKNQERAKECFLNAALYYEAWIEEKDEQGDTSTGQNSAAQAYINAAKNTQDRAEKRNLLLKAAKYKEIIGEVILAAKLYREVAENFDDLAQKVKHFLEAAMLFENNKEMSKAEEAYRLVAQYSDNPEEKAKWIEKANACKKLIPPPAKEEAEFMKLPRKN